MIIEFASEVSNLAWRVSQSQNGGAIFTLTKWSPMFGSVVFDHKWCILIVMSVKSSFYNEYDIKNNEKHVLWAQRSFQNHHQTFHDRCPEKIGPLPKKSDHLFTRTCPENIRPAPTWLLRVLVRALKLTTSKSFHWHLIDLNRWINWWLKAQLVLFWGNDSLSHMSTTSQAAPSDDRSWVENSRNTRSAVRKLTSDWTISVVRSV